MRLVKWPENVASAANPKFAQGFGVAHANFGFKAALESK
jgi:hypothetical protein